MGFTLAWHINPVEGSVVPRFLSDNPLGSAVFLVLFVTCMPAYIAGLILLGILGENNPAFPLAWLPQWLQTLAVPVITIQVILYFLLGKLVSVCGRRLSRVKNKAKAQAPMPDR